MNKSELQEYEEFSQRNFLEVVLKRRWMIAILFFAIFGAVVVGTLLMTPVFRTTAKIILEKKLEQEKYSLLNLPGIIRDPYDFIASEIEIIKSRPVAERVVRALQLARRSDPQSTRVSEANNQFQWAITDLVEKLDVQKVKDTNVITLSYCSEDPIVAVNVVNAVIEAYKSERLKITERSENSDYLERQIRFYDNKICSLMTLSADVKQEWEMHSAEQKAQTLQNNLSIFQEKLAETQSRYDAKRTRLSNLKRQISDGNDFLALDEEMSPTLVNHISKLKEQLLTLEVEITRGLQKYTPKHKLIIRLVEEKEYLQSLYQQSLRDYVKSEEAYIRVLSEQMHAYQSRCQEVSRQVAALSEPEKTQQMIERDLGSNREIYTMLVKQRGENQISNSKKGGEITVEIVSPPDRPLRPARPNKRLNFMLAGVLGMIISTGAAFGVEYLEHSYRMIQKKQLMQHPHVTLLPASFLNSSLNGGSDNSSYQEIFQTRRQFTSWPKGGASIALAILCGLILIGAVGLAIKIMPAQRNDGEQWRTEPMDMGELVEEKFVEIEKTTTLYELLLREFGMIHSELVNELKQANPKITESVMIPAGEKVYLPTSALASDTRLKRYAVHVFSLRKFKEAIGHYVRLTQQGYYAALFSVRDTEEGQFYKITLGSFAARKQAEGFRRELLAGNRFNYAALWDTGELFNSEKGKLALCYVVQ